MNTPSTVRKVFQGVADRHTMFRLFDRHKQRPNRPDEDAAALYAGEWFEIGEAGHDYMFESLPPLWIRGEMFALREFLTGSVTSVFFSLLIDGAIRHFHGYCDLSDARSVDHMRNAIVDRECRPVKAMTREERLEHIWSSTADAFRGYFDGRVPFSKRGGRTVVFYGGTSGGTPRLLESLTDAEIAAKLPVHLRYLPETLAA